MVAATQSYRERLKAQRAEARAKREAEKAEWHRRAELRYEIRKLAMDAVKPRIRARGDKLSLYSHAQLIAQANAMIGPWLVAQAKRQIAERTGHSLCHYAISRASEEPEMSGQVVRLRQAKIVRNATSRLGGRRGERCLPC